MEREQWLRELWALHGLALHNMARRLARNNEADAKDLVQDCLERAWKNHDQLREPQAARSWLTSILRNVFLDRCRRERKEPVDKDHRPDSPPDAPQEEPADDPLWTRLTTDDLQIALAELEPEFRIPFELREFKECSYREIAEQTGTPPATVATRLYRARLKLRELLSKIKR